jgi:hypothetical protein
MDKLGKIRFLFYVTLISILFSLWMPTSTGASPLNQGKGPKGPTFAEAVEPPAETISNAYIQSSVSASGCFVAGTTGGDPATINDDNKRLLFGYPSGIWSTYPSLRVTNGGTTNDYLLGYNEAPIAYPTNNGTTLLVVWSEEGVRVEQRISFAINPVTGRADTTSIEYTLQNNNASNRSIGLRLLLDVMIGGNDGAPYFILGNGRVTQQFEWTGTNVPDYWIAYESPTFDPNGLQGRGQLTGSGATKPNRFVIADWPQAYGTAWDYTVNPSDSVTNDSAVLLYYNPVTLPPGQRIVYKTFYGINAAAQAQLELIGLEATQAIQNLDDAVDMVSDKPTFVRAIVQSRSGTVNDVAARLIGRRNGVELPGSPLAPANKGGTIDIQENGDSHRMNLNDSFYFELPPSWRNGTVELEFKEDNRPIACLDHTDADNDCKVQVTFSDPPLPDVRFVGVSWREGDISHEPNIADIREVVQQLKITYPIADLQWDFPYTIEPIFLATQPSTKLEFARVNTMLSIQRTLDGCVFGCDRFYIGVVVSPPTNVSSYIAGLSSEDVLSGYANQYNTLAHELGHSAGRSHTNCAGNEPGADSTYPYKDGRISTDTTGDQAFYGFNIVTKKISVPRTGDLMGYCIPSWPSDWTYNHIRDNLLSRFGSSNVTAGFASEDTAALLNGEPALLISGIVQTSTDQGSIGSTYVIPSPASTPLPAPGSYAIKLENAVGQQLAVYSFQPSYGSEGDGEYGAFTLLLPWDPGTTRIVLLHNSVELASRTASGHAPGVTVTYPNGGEYLSGASAILTWSAEDLDGNTLEYAIQYSIDAGASWLTLASGLTATSYELDLQSIAGTSQGLLRVLATDGFRTTIDQSDNLFTVEKHAPQAVIQSPVNNSLYVEDQTLILEGYGYDNEDGQLGNEFLSWSSDLDGTLGTGKSLAVNAMTLTEGVHTITLTAHDGDLQKGSAQLTIQINRSRPTLPASLSIAPNAIILTGYEGSGQTPSELLSVRNDGDGSMYWYASADQQWIILSTVSAYAPTDFIVVADPTGLPIGDYTGNITISAYGDNSPQIIPVVLQVRDAPPTIVSIDRTSTYLTSAGSVSFIVSLSEPVTNLDAGDFTLSTTGALSGAYVSNVTGSGIGYTVTVKTGTGNGTIRLDVTDNNTIIDAVGIPLGGTSVGDGNFTTGEAYTIIKTPTFSDVPLTHPYWQDIEILYANNLTGGCQTSPLKYCPGQIMNRAQSAAFMMRATFGPTYVPNPTNYLFQDTDWSKGLWARPWAEAMREAGMTAGCKTTPMLFCPWVQLPREQVVIFALKMKYGDTYTPPAATGTVFADLTDPNYYATAWVEQAYADGLIQSCGMSGTKPKICPKDLVSRGLAAYMIVRARSLNTP